MSHAARALVAAACAVVIWAVGAGNVAAAGGPAGPAVSAARLRAHIEVLGSDAFEGRGPGSEGGRRAAAYLAGELKGIGLEPLGDRRTFLQRVPVQGSRALPECDLRLFEFGAQRRLRLGEDYLLFTGGEQTWIPSPVPMVFVGYGIVAPEFDYNDYLRVEVAGRVVVMLEGEPPSDDPGHFAGDQPTVYSTAEAKRRIAISRGAVGSILVPRPDRPTAERWERYQREFSSEGMALAYSVPNHLSVLLNPALAGDLFADALYDLPALLELERAGVIRSFHLPQTLLFKGVFRTRHFLTANVVGLLRGRDPALARSHVVVSAHYDHLGVGPAVAGDSIYNGVVDNALGVAGVLEVMRALAAGARPRRSVIVLLTAAEERGLLGASYFLDHPPVPLSSMIANINVDGLAFMDRFEDVIGVGAELSDLGEVLGLAAAGLGLEVSDVPPELASTESFARSDQLAFAQAGVPSMLVCEGFRWAHHGRAAALERSVEWLATVYHTPFDDLAQPLDLGAAAEHAGVILALVRGLAESERAPQWRPGTIYGYERQVSLAEGR